MRAIKRSLLFTATCVLMGSTLSIASPSSAPDFSPEALVRQRVSLYFEAAKTPLEKLAPQVYSLATESERCRMMSGAKACGLPSEPLKASGLRQIFEYYVAGPVEAGLSSQKVEIHKSNWSWQTAAKPR